MIRTWIPLPREEKVVAMILILDFNENPRVEGGLLELHITLLLEKVICMFSGAFG